jgi:predicted enzyme related to lactoylglutathione lyase
MDFTEAASVRYMIDDVPAAIAFYTEHLGFTLETDASPAFASVVRGPLRLLLSGARSSGARPMRDGSKPAPGGWTRILVTVDDIEGTVARLQAVGLVFRNDIVTGVGGSQVLLSDPSGNPVELFQPS